MCATVPPPPLPQELDQSKGQVETLESELRAETRRREEAELHVEERDADLASAFARLGEYERVCTLNKHECVFFPRTCISVSAKLHHEGWRMLCSFALH